MPFRDLFKRHRESREAASEPPPRDRTRNLYVPPQDVRRDQSTGRMQTRGGHNLYPREEDRTLLYPDPRLKQLPPLPGQREVRHYASSDALHHAGLERTVRPKFVSYDNLRAAMRNPPPRHGRQESPPRRLAQRRPYAEAHSSLSSLAVSHEEAEDNDDSLFGDSGPATTDDEALSHGSTGLRPRPPTQRRSRAPTRMAAAAEAARRSSFSSSSASGDDDEEDHGPQNGHASMAMMLDMPGSRARPVVFEGTPRMVSVHHSRPRR
ncbi:hypothetical protein JCM10207_001739 [Rhodosporidiobolus poonsookiae]